MEGNNKDGEIPKSQRKCGIYTSQSKGRNQIAGIRKRGTCRTNLGVGRGFPGGPVVKNLPC